MNRFAQIFLISLFTTTFSFADDEDLRKAHVKIYKKIADAVVGIQSGNNKGSGVIVDKEGWIISSTTAVGSWSKIIHVYLSDYSRIQGTVMMRNSQLELAVIKIDPKYVKTFIEIDDSDLVDVGQVAYTFGDAFDSIFNDNQVSISYGLVSGLYKITDPKNMSTYKGTIIETSCAVNPNQDGGPLVNSSGKLIGILSLNYHEAKYAGVAIPINVIKPHFDSTRRMYGEPHTGISVSESEGKVCVSELESKSPADRAGIKKDDVIICINQKQITKKEDYESLTRFLYPGYKIKIELLRSGKKMAFDFVVEERSIY